MPDRVKLPQGFPRRYGGIYKQVCEQQNPSSVARSAVRCLRKDCRDNGQGGITLIAEITDLIDPMCKNSLLRMMPDSWHEIYERIDLRVQLNDGDPYFLELAADACKQIATKREYGEEIENVELEIKKQFYLNVFAAQIEERIPYQTSFHAGADYDTIKTHLSKITPYLEQEIENWLLRIRPSQEIDLLEIDVMQATCSKLMGKQMDYRYIFSDFTDDFGHVRVINHRIGREYQILARIDDTHITQTDRGYLPSLLADLIDLAASIYVTDWLLPKKQNESCDICVELPVRNFDLFSQTWLLEELHNLLRWYTNDKWHFQFQKRKCALRKTERQSKLPLLQEPVEVALWSGGLDSLAGVCGRIQKNTASRYTLIGTGSNTQIQGKQAEIANVLKSKYLELKLIQLPIHLEYPCERPPTNDTFRARGFVFKILGAVCSLLENQRTLHIYENGFGAINLPFTRAERGIAHTRSVHPISLLDTSIFVSKILGSQFNYNNPYLFSTKAQMCNSIVSSADLAFRTISCDGRYRQMDQPTQCGSCSSCLLRRMALLVALGEDQTEYVVTHGTATLPKQSHFKAMDFQADKLNELLNSTNPWSSLLQRYPELRQLVNRLAIDYKESDKVIQDCLLQLYKSHVDEWKRTRHLLEV